MQVKCLWEVYGPNGRFDDQGNFVPTEKFGIIPSLFMNVVVLPIVVIYFGFLLSLEFLPRNIMSSLERRSRRQLHN
jgi:hypothetical protein